MSADPRIVYGADRVGLRFAVKDLLHPVGHHGQDFRLPGGGGSEVVAYEECVVVECGTGVTTGFTSMLGWYLVARAKSDGRLIGWAHLRRGTRAGLGKTLKPSDVVGLAASGPKTKVALGPDHAGDDYPGTAWDGAHIHTTDSDTIAGIFAGNTIDPLPRIKRALSSLAGTGALTPITTPAPQEDDMKDDERAALFAIKDKLDATVRSGYEHLLDVGDLGTILSEVKANRGAPHPMRSDYGRLLDLGDLAQLLNVTPAGTPTDPAAVANAILPALLQGLGDRLVTGEDLAATRDAILTAISGVDENTLAAFGLKRA